MTSILGWFDYYRRGDYNWNYETLDDFTEFGAFYYFLYVEGNLRSDEYEPEATGCDQ